jgi:uncharacterized membrane protein
MLNPISALALFATGDPVPGGTIILFIMAAIVFVCLATKETKENGYKLGAGGIFAAILGIGAGLSVSHFSTTASSSPGAGEIVAVSLGVFAFVLLIMFVFKLVNRQKRNDAKAIATLSVQREAGKKFHSQPLIRSLYAATIILAGVAIASFHAARSASATAPGSFDVVAWGFLFPLLGVLAIMIALSCMRRKQLDATGYSSRLSKPS